MPNNYMGLYNQGGDLNENATQTGGPQITDFDYTRLIVTEARYRKPFSQLAGKITKIGRNMGDEFRKERRYPILDDKNLFEEGIDAEGRVTKLGKWYALDDAGNFTEHDTQAAAKAVPNVVKVVRGGGALYGSSKDFVLQMDMMPTIPETPPSYNTVGSRNTILTGKIKLYKVATIFSRQEMELGARHLQLLKAKDITEMYSQVREDMIRNGLMTEAMTAPMYAGNAQTLDTMDQTCVVTYGKLRSFEGMLDDLRVPLSTNILVGTTKVGTLPLGSKRVLYIPMKLKKTIEEITRAGEYVFKEAHIYYANNGSNVQYAQKSNENDGLTGEIGAVGSFRFIADERMTYWAGAGAASNDGADADGDGIEDAGEAIMTTDNKYDVFPILSVGSGSFECLGLEGTDVEVKFNPPVEIASVPESGETGSVTCRFYHGMLINKSEHINVLLTTGLI